MTEAVVPTWAEANAKLSVAVNGAYLPFQDVPKTINRFVRPATFSTGDDTFELQVFGTAFMEPSETCALQ